MERDRPAVQQSKGADKSRPELNTGVYSNPGLEVLGASEILRSDTTMFHSG